MQWHLDLHRIIYDTSLCCGTGTVVTTQAEQVVAADAAERIKACDYPWIADGDAGALEVWKQDVRAHMNKYRR